jgi:hypothetical protein
MFKKIRLMTPDRQMTKFSVTWGNQPDQHGAANKGNVRKRSENIGVSTDE